MEPARSQVVKGLMEGLVLHALEREPTHGYGILKELESALGERPSKNKVYPLLRDLEEEDLVEAERVDDARQKQVYHLTEAGHERLAEFRSLPRPFRRWLAGLFGLDVEATGEVAPERADEAGPTVAVDEAWVPALLASLPDSTDVEAPHARFQVDRDPSQGTWSLTVERHEPGAYDGADRCPLTFLFLAIQQLCFDASLDD
jgi:PadR family transcriptional regulator PadR